MTILYGIDEPTQSPLVSDEEIRSIIRDEYGIVKAKITHLTGYEDCNMRLEEIEYDEKITKTMKEKPKEAIVKVTNPIEARYDAHIELQHNVYATFRKAGIPTVSPIRRLDGRLWAPIELLPGLKLPVRLFHLLPGRNLENFPFTPELCFQIGALLARIHKCFDAMDVKKTTESHLPFISPENHRCIEREAHVLVAKKMLSKERFDLVKTIFDDFRKTILDNEPLDYGLIHSDINETNVLIEENDGKLEISGVLDFGDMHFSHRVFDIAACVLYLHLSDSQLKQGIPEIEKNILLGYTSQREFREAEKLRSAMRARLACSLLYGLRTARLNVRCSSTEYVLRTQSNGWQVLIEV
ncbi:unnamed protein product, partial [Mesorhabditis belari]|uniref:Hydroxylysine kinase n=1 Tax=Mesorhabditis belari TaxID=2138241 RepID=A0AAF3EEN2_9BILA